MSLALRLSLGANIALLTAAVVLVNRDAPSLSPVPAAPNERPRTDPTKAATSSAIESAPRAPTFPTRDRANSPRVADTISRLEQKGISHAFLAEVVIQDFNRRWEKRLVELQRNYAPRPVPEREYIELARVRDAEQIRELKEALGEDGYLAWDKHETLRSFNSAGLPLAPAEAEQAYRLQKQLDETARELQRAMEDGVADKSDASTLQARAQDAFEKEVEQLLGRERYEQLRGITQPVAGVQMFADLTLSAEQTAVITQAEADYRAREAALARRIEEHPADADAITAELEALARAREENFSRAVGADTYVKLKREHDSTYQALEHYAGAWNMAKEEIQPVYETLDSFQQHAQRLREAARMSEAAGRAVDWNAVEASIETTRQEAEAGLLSLVGGERLRRLKQNGLLNPR